MVASSGSVDVLSRLSWSNCCHDSGLLLTWTHGTQLATEQLVLTTIMHFLEWRTFGPPELPLMGKRKHSGPQSLEAHVRTERDGQWGEARPRETRLTPDKGRQRGLEEDSVREHSAHSTQWRGKTHQEACMPSCFRGHHLIHLGVHGRAVCPSDQSKTLNTTQQPQPAFVSTSSRVVDI